MIILFIKKKLRPCIKFIPSNIFVSFEIVKVNCNALKDNVKEKPIFIVNVE